MSLSITLAPLADHPEHLETLVRWFESEWPAWYGPGGPGDARADLQAYAGRGRLPIGVIACAGGRLCGVAALKQDSLPSHAHLAPWAGAGLVDPAWRGQGVGRLLLAALGEQARALGFPVLYCGTATAHTLLLREGWEKLDEVPHADGPVGIYRKRLDAVPE